MSKHYDAVVLGSSVGALACAALLSRRSWRVLHLGQGARPQMYAYGDHALARRAFTMLFHASPAWTRILVELAQSQVFRRRVSWLDPMFQVLGAGYGIDLPPDQASFGKEVDREFLDVRRVIDDLYAELSRTNAIADVGFERDAVWPPGSFWERRETARIFATMPHAKAPQADFLAEFQRDHPYRDVVRVTARFASDLAGELPPFALARLHGAWTRGVAKLEGGGDELSDFLVERVRAHGGESRPSDRAIAIVHKGGKVRGVHIDGDDAPAGVQFVVSDLPTAELIALAPGFAPRREDRVARAEPEERRFVVSLVVRDAGIPAPLATESFLLPRARTEGTHVPEIHLQRLPGAVSGTTLLVCEAILPVEADAAFPIARAREAVLTALEGHVPFLERHVLVVDSPHDGRPLWDFSSGKRAEIDRARLRVSGGSLEAEPMIAKFGIASPSMDGLCGEPLRTPLGGAFAVGSCVFPSLGQEGQLIAAWGAARIITRTDRKKEKMRRDMWSKVELS